MIRVAIALLAPVTTVGPSVVDDMAARWLGGAKVTVEVVEGGVSGGDYTLRHIRLAADAIAAGPDIRDAVLRHEVGHLACGEMRDWRGPELVPLAWQAANGWGLDHPAESCAEALARWSTGDRTLAVRQWADAQGWAVAA